MNKYYIITYDLIMKYSWNQQSLPCLVLEYRGVWTPSWAPYIEGLNL